ncbi:MAG: hypothetical protein E6Q97_11370 [Desulfurellales bacterium]|nr:MAG: hypothetical protein E6Q97_11370 [Desulfurellales bacterium]
MSEAQTSNDTAEVKKAAKPKTEYFKVMMEDGREVEFAGKRKMDKTVIIEGDRVTTRYDFRNGATRSCVLTDLSPALQLQLMGHGGSQKIGDSAAGEESVDDMVLSVEKTIQMLQGGSWGVERAAGDSFKGGSIVVQALVEVTGKSVDAIKAFIDKKIEALKCSRQALYASFRADPKVGPVIERLEKEKAKPANVDTTGMLDEIGAA